MNITRKMATIRVVRAISPIPDADMIELAHVDDWQCVVNKGQFKVGDYGIYMEIDSRLPMMPIYEHLRKSCYRLFDDGTEGMLLRTMRFRGALSQGLLMPLSDYSEFDNENIHVGQDVSKMLGIVKWEEPIPECLIGEAKGYFPCFLSRTDEERIQNIFAEFKAKYPHIVFEASVKADGTSGTYYVNEGAYGFCSKEVEFMEYVDNIYGQISLKLDMRGRLLTTQKNIGIQGELCGPGIKKNRWNLKEHDFFTFNVYDIDKHALMLPEPRRKFVADLGLKHVPVLEEFAVFERFQTADELLEWVAQDPKREGVVFKSTEYILGQIVSFKVVSNRYLLK